MSNINDDTIRQFDAFNKWLGDVYEDDTSFSTLLIDAGFTEAEIEKIERAHLSRFLNSILNLIHDYDKHISNPARNRLMLIHYGLIDGQPEDFYTIGHYVGVCGERIRQLVTKRLRLYHDSKRQAQFKHDVATIARQILNG